jgi:hypothetical protein
VEVRVIHLIGMRWIEALSKNRLLGVLLLKHGHLLVEGCLVIVKHLHLVVLL